MVSTWSTFKFIFRAQFEDEGQNGIFFFGKWCDRIHERDRTDTQLLKWSRVVPSRKFYKDWYLDFVDALTVIESVTVLPKPQGPRDEYNIDLSNREMWVHSRGRTSYGEN